MEEIHIAEKEIANLIVDEILSLKRSSSMWLNTTILLGRVDGIQVHLHVTRDENEFMDDDPNEIYIQKVQAPDRVKGFGKDPGQLHRKNAPDTSVAAANKVDSKGDEEKVYAIICQHPNGITAKELGPLMGKAMSSFSGRISGLIEKRMVKDSGRRRDGCRVIVDAR